MKSVISSTRSLPFLLTNRDVYEVLKWDFERCPKCGNAVVMESDEEVHEGEMPDFVLWAIVYCANCGFHADDICLDLALTGRPLRDLEFEALEEEGIKKEEMFERSQ